MLSLLDKFNFGLIQAVNAVEIFRTRTKSQLILAHTNRFDNVVNFRPISKLFFPDKTLKQSYR